MEGKRSIISSIEDKLDLERVTRAYTLCGRLRADLENVRPARLSQIKTQILSNIDAAISNYDRADFNPAIVGPEYGWNKDKTSHFKKEAPKFLEQQNFEMTQEELSTLPNYILLGLIVFIGMEHFRESPYMIDLISTQFTVRY